MCDQRAQAGPSSWRRLNSRYLGVWPSCPDIGLDEFARVSLGLSQGVLLLLTKLFSARTQQVKFTCRKASDGAATWQTGSSESLLFILKRSRSDLC